MNKMELLDRIDEAELSVNDETSSQDVYMCSKCQCATVHLFDKVEGFEDVDFGDVKCCRCGSLNYLIIRGVLRENR